MFGKRFWKYICMSALPALLFACREEVSYVEKASLASVGDVHLYKDQADIVFAQQHRTDSAEFMHGYIERWAMDVLFYEKIFILSACFCYACFTYCRRPHLQ